MGALKRLSEKGWILTGLAGWSLGNRRIGSEFLLAEGGNGPNNDHLSLIIREPTGAWMPGSMLMERHSGSWWSGNVFRGYGPEGWALQGLIPGTYHFAARFYGAWNDDSLSTATAEIEFTRNFGTPEETREVHALRVEKKPR